MENLKKARKAKNITQSKLAEKLHLTKSAISKYETGQLEPSCKTIIELCKILDVSSDYLLEIKKEPKEELSNQEKIILGAYRKAPEDMKEAIRRILKIQHKKTPIEEKEK